VTECAAATQRTHAKGLHPNAFRTGRRSQHPGRFSIYCFRLIQTFRDLVTNDRQASMEQRQGCKAGWL